mmetsp:Transcript_64878/g.154928  ORF Transcript_64878/g.154928 Transcript_64878/m.154928 type:complete len:209 (-) Transcript_64878:248-874(-)
MNPTPRPDQVQAAAAASAAAPPSLLMIAVLPAPCSVRFVQHLSIAGHAVGEHPCLDCRGETLPSVPDSPQQRQPSSLPLQPHAAAQQLSHHPTPSRSLNLHHSQQTWELLHVHTLGAVQGLPLRLRLCPRWGPKLPQSLCGSALSVPQKWRCSACFQYPSVSQGRNQIHLAPEMTPLRSCRHSSQIAATKEHLSAEPSSAEGSEGLGQ